MAVDGIFLKAAGGLTVLKQADYNSESILQTALAEHPEVLAGPTTMGEDEARLLLIRREMRVPSERNGAGTFSLDHLFVDADGVPVLVEVKRSSDTRIRREVVGQMLDYAANAVSYWPIADLQESLQQTALAAGRQADELIQELRPDADAGEFWRTVETNLRAGRIRMLFVADVLPDELVRIIEFLNEQMSPAEVLGVELRQYVSGEHVAYVPRLVGRTSTAVAAKSGGLAAGQQWNRESFLAAADGRCSAVERSFIRRLLDDVDGRGLRLSWGKGVTPGVAGWYSVNGEPTGVWVLNANNESPNTRAYLVFYLADLVTRLGSERVERTARLLEELPTLTEKIGVARASDWRKYPSLYLPDVAGDAAKEQVVLAAISDLLAPV